MKNGKKITDQATLVIPTLVSRIFDPPVIVTLLTFIGVVKSELSHRGLMTFAILIPFFLGLPLGYFLWSLKTRQVSNWDVTNRKERLVPLAALLGFLTVDLFIISFFDNPFLLNMFFVYFLWTIGFLGITFFWKISGHTGITTLAAGLLTQWFGWEFSLLFLCVPLVAWARIVRSDHTIYQVVAGVLYSLAILAIFSSWVY